VAVSERREAEQHVARIEIVEVGPRDGLQNTDTLVDTPTKVRLIERMLDAGVTRIEAVSFVHPGRVPQMADAEQVMAAVPRDRGASYIGLVLNDRGLDRALAADVDETNVVVVVSETFSRRNQGVGVDDMLAAWERVAGRARDAGLRTSVTLSAAFGCPFEGEVDPARVVDIAARVADAGPDEIALADTIGVAVPPQVTDLMARVADRVGPIPLRCHFHNTRNTGFANVVAALEAGVAALDASVGGIGGCPFAPEATGNIATEDLIYLLDRMGVEHGVSLAATSQVAEWVGDQLGMTVPGLLSRAGPFPGAA
jgi:hydroxymethylglutaryl-CoA lyase